MESSLAPLQPLFESERASGRALVLGVVLETAGSTYRKPGALMLIAQDGRYAGLLSGGCLEGDLREHARSVSDTGAPRVVSYDLRSPDDVLWGLGVGCEGAMSILLTRVGPDNDWQPLAHLSAQLAAHRPSAVGIVVESSLGLVPAGTIVLPETISGASPVATETVRSALAEAARSGTPGWIKEAPAGVKLFALPLALPPRILLLGAGPDTVPVVEFAVRLGWKVTLVDHRPAYAQAANFPGAERVVHARPDEFASIIALGDYAAAVVMSHHLPSDLAYLRTLASSDVPYVGLLGPAVRREKLLSDLGEAAERLRPRLRAPVGLAIGGRAPESIALAIVSEIHAFLHDARGRPFSEMA